MEGQVPHIVRCDISGETAGEIKLFRSERANTKVILASAMFSLFFIGLIELRNLPKP